MINNITVHFPNSIIPLFSNWTVNHDVGCQSYTELEAEIKHRENLTATHTYCNERDTKYCKKKCTEIQFSELQCALPRCPNITKDQLTFIYPEKQGAKLTSLPEFDERFDVNSNAIFECIDPGKKLYFYLPCPIFEIIVNNLKNLIF